MAASEKKGGPRHTPKWLFSENPSAPVESYKSTEYCLNDVRMLSFSKWSADSVQTPEKLAKAGFFYTGIQDLVRCFACDGLLQNWNPGDDPWVEHAHWFPQCIYLRQIRGEENINSIPLTVDNGDKEEDGVRETAHRMNELQINNENDK